MGDWLGFIPNYTGPYISNGKFQPSVQFGDRRPKDALDALSRLHDTAYAKWDDRLHRTIADRIYNEDAKQLSGMFPEVARFAVTYGNQTINSFNNIKKNWMYGPFGILKGGVENAYDLFQVIDQGDAVAREIRNYYKTDPFIELQLGGRKEKNGRR